jgi:uncharacterized protein YndB with AHSA1/START domain
MTNAATDILSVVIERDIPFPPEKIWRALTQPQLIEAWLMKNDFQPVVGHKFNFREDWGTLDCEVRTVEPNKRLAYSWDFNNPDPNFSMKSVVTFTLTPTSSGTHLRVEQVGFRPEQQQAYNGAKWGWQKFLAALEKLVAENG